MHFVLPAALWKELDVQFEPRASEYREIRVRQLGKGILKIISQFNIKESWEDNWILRKMQSIIIYGVRCVHVQLEYLM